MTSKTFGQRNTLQSDRKASLLIQTLFDYRDRGNFLVHEFVVMPDHLHVLLTVGAISIEKAAQLIKGGYSFRVKKELAINGEVWQPGFSENRVYDQRAYGAHKKYIWNNPVKAGLAGSPELYPHSSASGNFKLDLTPEHLRG